MLPTATGSQAVWIVRVRTNRDALIRLSTTLTEMFRNHVTQTSDTALLTATGPIREQPQASDSDGDSYWYWIFQIQADAPSLYRLKSASQMIDLHIQSVDRAARAWIEGPLVTSPPRTLAELANTEISLDTLQMPVSWLLDAWHSSTAGFGEKALRHGNLRYVGDVIVMTSDQVREVKGFGAATLTGLRDVLEIKGFALETVLPLQLAADYAEWRKSAPGS